LSPGRDNANLNLSHNTTPSLLQTNSAQVSSHEVVGGATAALSPHRHVANPNPVYQNMTPISPPNVTTVLPPNQHRIQPISHYQGISSMPAPIRRTKAIRSTTGVQTVWYPSTGKDAIPKPEIGPCNTGDLYVHCYDAGGVFQFQVWLWNGPNEWLPIAEAHQHPILHDHVFILTRQGDPSWIRRKSLVTYSARSRLQRSL
jgi:hypothetical protein